MVLSIGLVALRTSTRQLRTALCPRAHGITHVDQSTGSLRNLAKPIPLAIYKLPLIAPAPCYPVPCPWVQPSVWPACNTEVCFLLSLVSLCCIPPLKLSPTAHTVSGSLLYLKGMWGKGRWSPLSRNLQSSRRNTNPYMKR